MIDPVTGLFKIVELPNLTNPSSAATSQAFNNTWLCRYPCPRNVIYNNGSEFKLHFKQLCKEFGLKRKPVTVKNPQANAIVERVHQVVGNMLQTFKLESYDFDPKNPWGDLLSGITWAIRSTYHTTLKATPGQLVFGRDMIHNLKFTANWEDIRRQKQALIDLSNAHKNKSRFDYNYTIGDKVLIFQDKLQHKLNEPYEGPYSILQIYANGTVKIQHGPVQELINI